MTLHWWMHWFWVTMLLTVLAATRENHAAPQRQGGDGERQARAMYFTKSPPTAAAPPVPPAPTDGGNTTRPDPIQWTAVDEPAVTPAATSLPATPSTVPPPTVPPQAVPPAVPPPAAAEPPNATVARRRNLTRPLVVQAERAAEGVAESRIVTERPLSLETSFLQTRVPPAGAGAGAAAGGGPAGAARRGERGLDAGAVAGIALGALALAALAGSTGLVLYRRRYLNKPQTLNDKCSNPDSSGYLDDSTIRDNSEEMYSLDNDSFLNSLEAMTIQNYWTDTVKHTKL